MLEAVIFDIDGTLANCEHRRHYVQQEDKNWKAFNDNMHLDTVNDPIKKLFNCLQHSHSYLIIVTGRSEDYCEVTANWLADNGIYFYKMYMRKSGDYRPDTIIKQEILDQIKSEGYIPWLVIDDRKSVVDMWRANGITCLQCAEGDF